MNDMSERILLILKKRGISKTEFAKELNITQAYVSKIINKGAMPSNRLIEDICEKFSVNEEWLRTGEGEMYRQSSDEIAYYVEELLDYNGHGNPFYDMIIEMMKTYHSLDDKSKKIMREYFQTIGKALDAKKEIPSTPEDLEQQYPPVPDETADAG